MAVNSMSFKQSSTLINEVLSQMTGQTSIAPVDESEFVAVGTTLLQAGYDALNTAVSQVLTRSIYSSRAYNPIYPSIERDSVEWGGIVRKVTTLDLEFMDDKGYNVANGKGVTDCDPFLVNRQKAVQFNWYGGNTKELLVTVTEHICINMMKRKSYKTEINGLGEKELIIAETTPSTYDNTEDIYFEKFDIAEIKAAISRLPQKLQNTLILYAVEGYSMKELAELDDCSVEAVKKRVQRARAKIIEALQVV